MNRKSFFKTLLGGAAVAVIAPQVLAKDRSEYGVAVDVATIPKSMSMDELLRYYRGTGCFPGRYYRNFSEYEAAMLRAHSEINDRRESYIAFYDENNNTF